VWSIARNPDGTFATNDIKMMLTHIKGAVDIAFGPDDCLYITQMADGKVWRYQYTGGGAVPPIARVRTVPSSAHGSLSTPIRFDATGSQDPLKGKLRYEWDFEGNGHFINGDMKMSYHYKTKGAFKAKLRISSDKGGGVTEKEIKVFPGYELKETLEFSVSNYAFKVNDPIRVIGHVVSETGQQVEEAGLHWTVHISHCYAPPECLPNQKHCHYHLVSEFDSREINLLAPDHEYPSHLSFSLEATHPEQKELVVRFVRHLFPRMSEMMLDTNPSGLHLLTDLQEVKAPYKMKGLDGGKLPVELSSLQLNDNREAYQFVDWTEVDNKSAPKQSFRFGKNGTSYVANFRKVSILKLPQDGFNLAMPENVRVVGGWRECTVSWELHHAAEDPNRVTHYIIYHREIKFMQPEPISDFKSHMVSGSSNSWVLKNVDVNSLCEFQVAAVISEGEGPSSPVAQRRSLMVPPVDVQDCPEKQCKFKGAILDDFNHGMSPKNFNNYFQEPDGGVEMFLIRNDKLVFKAEADKLKTAYWYSSITDEKVQCYNLQAYYTSLVFKVKAPEGTDFSIGLHTKTKDCKSNLDGRRKTARLSTYSKMNGQEQIVKIPINDLSHDPSHVVSVFFFEFNSAAEIEFDDLGFINRCEDRPSAGHKTYEKNSVLQSLSTGAGILVAGCAMIL
jgi:hypothetical protein